MGRFEHRREPKEFEEKVIQVRRVCKVVSGGKRLGFRVLSVIGDKKGRVGIGLARAGEVVAAIRKSMEIEFLVSCVIGEEVPHAHVWLVPRYDNDGHGSFIDIDKIVEVSDEEIAFLDRISPTYAGKKLSVPPPTMCFDCRLQRRLAFYNSRALYKRKCDFSGKEIVSNYKPDAPFVIYDKGIWFSDKHNALDYGRDFDFNRPFFEQFRELMKTVPLLSIAVIGKENINSDYTNDNWKLKNCYLVFDGEQAEDAYYGHTFVGLKSCIDFLAIERSELCYECIHCYNCYNTKSTRRCSSNWFYNELIFFTY